jgi:hypothetical protein
MASTTENTFHSTVHSCHTERNGLSGTLASELSTLRDLLSLQLEDGVISGEIPSEYGSMTSLEVIDLNFNFIGGRIPDELFQLTGLRQPIGTGFGQLTGLTFLQLQRNELTGQIPAEIGNLDVLGQYQLLCHVVLVQKSGHAQHIPQHFPLCFTGTATFHSNNLQGSMPDAICALRDGELTRLTADCVGDSNSPSPPYVACDCCTQCF